MDKQILQIEIRYNSINNNLMNSYKEKVITIGIYNTLEDAVKEGNKILKRLNKYFEIRSDDKFEVRGTFGLPVKLVTNVCYPTKGISYFAKIETLNFNDVEDTIKTIFKSKGISYESI